MSFRSRVRKAMSRGSSSASSPVESTLPSEASSGLTTPTLIGSNSIDRDHLTIDPRENILTQVDSNVTLKKRSTMGRIRSAMKKEDPYANWPEDIYKPHELPRPKYRRPVDAKHDAVLQGYSLRSAFADMRRKSNLTQYSPFGSRLSSRRNSFSSRFGPSAAPSRNHSIVGILTENEDDADVTNGRWENILLDGNTKRITVGLSRPHTASDGLIPQRQRGVTITNDTPVPDLVTSSSVGSNDTDSSLHTSQAATLNAASRAGGLLDGSQQYAKPFDEEELTRALTRQLATTAV